MNSLSPDRESNEQQQNNRASTTMFGPGRTMHPPAEPMGRRTAYNQFEDADDDDDDVVIVECVKQAKDCDKFVNSKPKTTSSALDFLADASLKHTQAPLRGALERRISSSTNNATNTLLEIARGRSAPKAKPQYHLHQHQQSTKSSDLVDNDASSFGRHLSMVQKYKIRYGVLDVRRPQCQEGWEQGMWAWLAECRSSFRAGRMSAAQARALTEMGVPGFSFTVGSTPSSSSATVATTGATPPPQAMMPSVPSAGPHQQQKEKQQEYQKQHQLNQLRIMEQAAKRQQQGPASHMNGGGRPNLNNRNQMDPSNRSDQAAMMMAMMAQQQQQRARGQPRGMPPQGQGQPNPAVMHALMMRQRQEQQARMVQQQQQQQLQKQQLLQKEKHQEPVVLPASLNQRSRSNQDPDGALPDDTDLYPKVGKGGQSSAGSSTTISKHDTSHLVKAMQKDGPKKSKIVSPLEIVMRREALAREEKHREAIAREQKKMAALASSAVLPKGFNSTAGTGLRGRGVGANLHSLARNVPQSMQMAQQAQFMNMNPAHMQAFLRTNMAQRGVADGRFGQALHETPLSVPSGTISIPNGTYPTRQDRRASDSTHSTLNSGPNGSKKPSTSKGRKRKGSQKNDGNPHKTVKREQKARKSWDDRIRQMRLFFLTHGHTQVLTRGEDKELGRWLSSVRCKIRDKVLPPRRVQEFDAMEHWELETGHFLDQERKTVAADVSTADTRAKQQESYLVGDNSGYSSTPASATNAAVLGAAGVPREMIVNYPPYHHQTSSLEAPISPGSLRRPQPRSWDQSFGEMLAFKQVFGHCDVKMIVNSPYVQLGKWLASQRSRHRLGQFPEDKVKRLRGIGCSGFEPIAAGMNPPYRSDSEESPFDYTVARLQGAALQPGSGYGSDNSAPSSLGDPKQGKEKRVRYSYPKRLEHVKAYKAKYGHCKIKLGVEDKHEELLARWLASARCRYRNGDFKENRALDLHNLGCDGFSPLKDAPQARAIADTEKATVKFGDPETRKGDSPARTATPSPTHALGGKEGEIAIKKQKLAKDGAKRPTFDDLMKELVSYQYVYGIGCSVPKPDGDGGKLGRWLAFQRRQFLAGKLDQDRIAQLRQIGRKEFCETDLVVRAAERAAASVLDH